MDVLKWIKLILDMGCWFFCQALPIFLDSLVVAWGAILISVTLILLFGEVRTEKIILYLHSSVTKLAVSLKVKVL